MPTMTREEYKQILARRQQQGHSGNSQPHVTGATPMPAPQQDNRTALEKAGNPFGPSSQKPSSTMWSLVKGVTKAVGGEIAKTAVQLPRSFAAGVSGLAGNEKAEEYFSKPVNVPILGEVKGLSAAPQDIKKYNTQTAEETAGQAVGMAGELLAATGLGTLSKGASLAQKASSGAKLGGTLGVLGSTSQAMEANKDAKNVATEAVIGGLAGSAIGGAFPVVSEGVRKAAGKISSATANRLIKPLTKEFSFGKNPGRAMVKEGITGSSFEELGQSASSKLKEIGSQIDETLKAATGKTVDATSAVSIIDEEMQKAAEANQQGLFDRLKQLKETLTKTRRVGETGIEVAGERDLTNLSAEEASKLKRAIGDHTQWTGQAFDKDVNRIGSKIYASLRSGIEAVAPEVKQLNERYGNMLSVVKSIQRAGQIHEAKTMRGDLYDVAAGAGAIGELARGNVKAAVEIGGADLLRHLLGTPAASTNIASALSSLSEKDMISLAESHPAFAKVLRTLANTALKGTSKAVSE